MPQLWFFVSIAFSLIAWGIVTARYIWPALRLRQRTEALRPLFILHSFRFIGLALLVPGVVSPDLPATFAHSTAYGDFIAAILALFSLLLLPSAAGVAVAWIFSLWGSADPVYGGTKKFQEDPHWRDYILFYEYFHGDNGAGLGASHQTGWTGLIARTLDLFARGKTGKCDAALSIRRWRKLTREQGFRVMK